MFLMGTQKRDKDKDWNRVTVDSLNKREWSNLKSVVCCQRLLKSINHLVFQKFILKALKKVTFTNNILQKA